MKNITSLFIIALFVCFFSIHTTRAASANLALGKVVSAKVNNMNGASSNDRDAGLMTDGDTNTAWESLNSFKHSILIDLGSKFKITKIVVKWTDQQAANTMTFSFGDTKEAMLQTLSRKDMTETIETVFDSFDENARFIEILLHGRINSSKGYKISEIEVYGEDNIALLKPVSARVTSMNGSPSNQELAHLLNDGDFDTYWESPESFKHSILIDLEEKRKITRVVIKWADKHASSSVDLSFGETTESMVKAWSRNNLTDSVESVYDNLDEEARYFELMVRGRMNSTYRIREIEIYDDNANKHVNTPEEQASIDKITERLITEILSGGFEDAKAAHYASTMLEDGSWPDVDYADGTSIGSSWSPLSHLNRLKAMSIAFRHTDSPLYKDAELLAKIQKGLLCFKTKLPKCTDNWWYNEIGAPQIYMIPVLLIKDDVLEKDMPIVSSYLKDKIDSYMGEAKNLAWIANIALHKGCAEDNFSIVEHAFDALSSTLTIVPKQGDEGIKIDGSFHQHHSQLYSGGYGLSLITDLVKYQNMCEGTLFMNRFTPEKMEIFRSLLFEGILQLSYRHTMDFGTRGRNISRDPNVNYSTISKSDLGYMIINDPEYAPTYQTWLDYIDNNASSPKAGVNKYFWKSDIMSEHGENYYLSAKIISERSYGTEALNGENIKAYNLPLGATNIMTTGNEYDRIFPVWDWTRIPGTTAVQNQDYTKLDGYIIGTNEFGGGVSNGTDGIVAYKHDYKNLKAKKSYFFIDNMMFCIGNGVNFAGDEQVVTSVNQAYLLGDVTINNGSDRTLSAQSSETFDNLKWVHHDNVGYIFPDDKSVHVQNIQQSGKWYDINTSLGTTSVISKDIFSVWFDHGTAPENGTYEYIVVPDQTLDQFKEIAADHGFIISQNDDVAQALRKGNKYGIVFYEPGNVIMDNGLEISSDKQAIVYIEVDDKEYDISVADPIHKESKITLTINKELKTQTYSANSALEFVLPTGDYVGSTLTQSYTEGDPVGIGEEEQVESAYVYQSGNEVKVNFTAGIYNQLEILDMNGKVTCKNRISTGQQDMSISSVNYVPGVYFVKLSGENNTKVLKFIIVR